MEKAMCIYILELWCDLVCMYKQRSVCSSKNHFHNFFFRLPLLKRHASALPPLGCRTLAAVGRRLRDERETSLRFPSSARPTHEEASRSLTEVFHHSSRPEKRLLGQKLMSLNDSQPGKRIAACKVKP